VCSSDLTSSVRSVDALRSSSSAPPTPSRWRPVRDVDLIRHAYVAPFSQRGGIGGALLERLMDGRTRRVLVGTWAAAGWAIAFYERHGFAYVGRERTAALLREYWTIPERQIDTSVVLARPPFGQS